MANRYNTNYIVQEGKYKGYRRDDADDAYWSVGYTLPKLPNYQGWRMRTFCIKSVSDYHLNIEVLPTLLRTLVNKYHAEFGVGRVEDVNTFSIGCYNHQTKSVRKCRQCRARRDTVKLVLQQKLKMEVTHGLLVRKGWEPPKVKEEKEEEPVQGREGATSTTSGDTPLILKTSGKEVWIYQEKPLGDKEQTKRERLEVLMAHEPVMKVKRGKISITRGRSNEQKEGTQKKEQKTTEENIKGRKVGQGIPTGTVEEQEEEISQKGTIMRGVNPSEWKEGYLCTGCGRGYKYKRNLTRHARGQGEVLRENSSEEQEEQAVSCRNASLLGNRKILGCVRLSEHAQIPTRGTNGSAGHDLYSAYDYTIDMGGQVLIKTDLQIAMPPGCYGRIAPRSSLTYLHGIHVGAGVIDPDYRGNVGIVLFNLGKKDYTVKRGDRCAQLILEQIYTPLVIEMETLQGTSRGKGAFGSTGK